MAIDGLQCGHIVGGGQIVIGDLHSLRQVERCVQRQYDLVVDYLKAADRRNGFAVTNNKLADGRNMFCIKSFFKIQCDDITESVDTGIDQRSIWSVEFVMLLRGKVVIVSKNFFQAGCRNAVPEIRKRNLYVIVSRQTVRPEGLQCASKHILHLIA